MSAKPKLLFFITVDWFFCSHFLDRAVAARDAGYDVMVVTRVEHDGQRIVEHGLRLIPIDIDRRSLNPFGALGALWQVLRIYRRERPDILHHIAIKPILLGTLAARLLRMRGVVNAIVGMGYLSTSDRPSVRLLRPLLDLGLRWLLNPPGSRVVFENGDDLDNFVRQGQVRPEDAVLIRGAGVNPEAYPARHPQDGPPMVVLVARMLWDKGVGEFVAAACMLRAQGCEARFVLVGDTDPGNRGAIAEHVLRQWHGKGAVEWLGYRTDIPALLSEAQVACLPSYREGLPKSLLEAMAAGLPCVTTDVPGCREVIRDGDNGLLVPPRDADALAGALQRLLKDPAGAIEMGRRGRARIELEFSSQRVEGETLELYHRMLA